MIPATTDVYNLARFHLGDTEVPSGQWATNTFLTQFFNSAYQSLYRWLQRNRAELLRTTRFYNLPANTAFLTPASVGLKNFGSPEDIFDRTVGITLAGSVTAINAYSPSTGVPSSVDITTTTNHGLSSGAQVITFGFSDGVITDDVNDQWYISVESPTVIRLNGCGATGSTGTVGVVTTGAELWPANPIYRVMDIRNQWPATPNSQSITAWYWNNDAFRFMPSNTTRQLKIVFDLSGNPPASGSVGIDDSLDALATATAAMAAKSKMFTNKAADLSMRSVGNQSLDFYNVRGGYFAEMAQLSTQEFQKVRVVTGRYRRKRNVGPGIPW